MNKFKCLNSCQPTLSILVTLPSLQGKGGVSGLWHNLLPQMERDGFRVRLMEIGSKTGSIIHPIADQLRFRTTLRQLKPDLVHVNPSLGLKSFLRDGLFVWQCVRASVPVLVYFHGWNMTFQAKLERHWLWFFNCTFNHADQFIVLASAFKEKLEQWGVEAPISVDTTAVAEDILAGFTLQDRLKVLSECQVLRILFLARVEKAKGIFELLDALAILVGQGHRVTLTIAGDGPDMAEATHKIHALHLQDCVEILGYVQGESKRLAFQRAHIYVLPSHSEGMPVSVLEAMAFGLPVITRAVGGLQDLFRKGAQGQITDSKDPNVLASLIAELASDRSRLADISESNFRYAQDHLYASHAASRIRQAYLDALQTNQGRGIKGDKP